MRRLLVLSFALFALLPGAVSLSAQQSLAEAAAQAKTARQQLPVDAPTRDQIVKLLDLLQVRRNIQTVLDGTKEQMLKGAEQGFRRKVPDATPEQMESLRGMVDDEFSETSVDELVQIIIPIYQRHWTKSDVEQITAFYSSPIGQKVLRE